ncbi:hypothetical protein QBC47DRAFT_174500 [Echria macrotheca]|uniref:Uncharacterized protein n=1 Tax=Echria macrotheca TaxID=438768 RepID=A0AAJ0BJH8_9PEZI|nr:hypothetical protein QBC47DRAFT_174500 [Echria macrotheca]
MLFLRSLATAAVLAAGTLAFKLPAGLADGSYVAYRDETGKQVIEAFTTEVANRIGTQSNATSEQGVKPARTDSSDKRGIGSAGLEERDEWFWVSYCGCGFNLDHGNTDRAVQGIKDQCGSCNLAHDQAIFTIAGDVVAFICNGGPTSASLITRAAEIITQRCGWYVAGTAYLEKGLWYEPDIGYMRWFAGLDFCGASEGGTSGNC